MLLALGTVLTMTRWRRAGIAVNLFVLAVALMIATLPVANWVAGPLENRFPVPQDLPKHIDGIMVLGGGENRQVSKAHGVASMHNSVLRLVTAAALLRAHPEAQLYFSGGGAVAVVTPPTESDIAQILLSEMGTDAARVHLENKSRNTWENFVFTKALAQPKPGETWVLVTSATHMPRSIGIARQVGWPMIAYPTDFVTSPYPVSPLGLMPQLETLDIAGHEWLGLIGYYLSHKTSALFPAPQ